MGIRGGLSAVLSHRESLKRVREAENSGVPEQGTLPDEPAGRSRSRNSSNEEEDRVKLLNFFESVRLVEAATGKPLNLTPDEVGVAVEYGLDVLLKMRLKTERS